MEIPKVKIYEGRFYNFIKRVGDLFLYEDEKIKTKICFSAYELGLIEDIKVFDDEEMTDEETRKHDKATYNLYNINGQIVDTGTGNELGRKYKLMPQLIEQMSISGAKIQGRYKVVKI